MFFSIDSVDGEVKNVKIAESSRASNRGVFFIQRSGKDEGDPLLGKPTVGSQRGILQPGKIMIRPRGPDDCNRIPDYNDIADPVWRQLEFLAGHLPVKNPFDPGRESIKGMIDVNSTWLKQKTVTKEPREPW